MSTEGKSEWTEFLYDDSVVIIAILNSWLDCFNVGPSPNKNSGYGVVFKKPTVIGQGQSIGLNVFFNGQVNT